MIATFAALTAVDAMREIVVRRISLTCAFDGNLWSASVERVKNKKRFTKPDMEVISATASTPMQAVAALCAKLDAIEGQTTFLDYEY
jgi:hypothetical protein